MVDGQNKAAHEWQRAAVGGKNIIRLRDGVPTMSKDCGMTLRGATQYYDIAAYCCHLLLPVHRFVLCIHH
jgi:hypothetical protein